MTISSIGSNLSPDKPRLNKRPQGFTFIEIMTTLAILTGGVVMLYKSFFICLDYQNHLAFRIRASNILEHRIALTEQMLRDYKVLSFSKDTQQETAVINNQELVYRVDVQLAPAGDEVTIYQIDVSIAWQEKKREVVLRRSAFISNLTSVRNIS